MRRGLIPMALVAGLVAQAQTPLQPVDAATLARLKAQQAERVKLLDPSVQALVGSGATFASSAGKHEMRLRTSEVDPFGRTIARYDHYWNGIRVAAEAIGILGADDRVQSVRYGYKNLLEPPSGLAKPVINAHEAGLLALSAIGPSAMGAREGFKELVLEPQVETVALPWPSAFSTKGRNGDPSLRVRLLKDWKLVYRVHHEIRYPNPQARLTRIDAMNGETLSSAPNHSCSAATLTANTVFYRDQGSAVPFLGEWNGSAYLLRRGSLFGVRPENNISPYSSPAPHFGDGNEFITGGSLTGPNGQTQAAEIMIGLNKAYDFYQAVYSRSHIDGSDGYYVSATAHVENLSAPAYAWWSSNWPYAESYGLRFRSRQNTNEPGGPTELSVVAHEWSHLVNFRSARVGREGSDPIEAKAVNEAFATILSTACRLWDATGRGGAIGTPDPSRWKYDWSYQPQVNGGSPSDPASAPAKGTEVLFRPSYPYLREPSWWNPSNAGVNGVEHRLGAPLHRAFYFLANGANPITNLTDTSDDARGRTSPFTPWGFPGIGAQQAAQVFYYALTQTMGRGSDIFHVGNDLVRAAQTLYGTDSPQVRVVRNSLWATNLGLPDGVSYPAGSQRANPSGLPDFLPAGVHAASMGADVLPAGSDAHHFWVVIPPFSSVNAVVMSKPQNGVWTGLIGQFPNLEVWSADGGTRLGIGTSIVVTDPYAVPTGAVFGDTPPTVPLDGELPSAVQTEVAWKNPNATPLRVLLKFRSSKARTGAWDYEGAGNVRITDYTDNDAEANQW